VLTSWPDRPSTASHLVRGEAEQVGLEAAPGLDKARVLLRVRALQRGRVLSTKAAQRGLVSAAAAGVRKWRGAAGVARFRPACILARSAVWLTRPPDDLSARSHWHRQADRRKRTSAKQTKIVATTESKMDDRIVHMAYPIEALATKVKTTTLKVSARRTTGA
jgi:hypothetical protein